MKTGMLYDPLRKILYNFYPIDFYVIRRNVDLYVNDGLYIFSGSQQVEIYDKNGFHIMYSSEAWMTEHPVQMLNA